ncbi:hypothetical protein HYW68_00480 [Candidatus Parcubacteria bacterium]|nr:hypothetical protein [Candidatus Parcubacteria bacterium]
MSVLKLSGEVCGFSACGVNPETHLQPVCGAFERGHFLWHVRERLGRKFIVVPPAGIRTCADGNKAQNRNAHLEAKAAANVMQKAHNGAVGPGNVELRRPGKGLRRGSADCLPHCRFVPACIAQLFDDLIIGEPRCALSA